MATTTESGADWDFFNKASGRITSQIAISTAELGVCIVSLTLLLIIWKRDDKYKRAVYSTCEYASLGLSISIIAGAATSIKQSPETVALQDISNKYDDLLIATLVMASVALLFDVVALVVHNMCMCKLGCRANREDAPSYVKGYTVHIVYISFALLVSATIAIWNLVVGQQLRDFHSFWTWEVFLISFVGIIAILVLVGIIIYFACVRKQHNEQLA